MTKTIDNKIRLHRIILHNEVASEETVSNVARDELGKNIQIKNWNLEETYNYESPVKGMGTELLPQTDYVVKLQYREASE